MQSMEKATSLGTFLAAHREETMNNYMNYYNHNNINIHKKVNSDATVATVSVMTDAYSSIGASHNPAATSTSHYDEDENDDVDDNATFQSENDQAEKVWFSSITDRFQRFSGEAPAAENDKKSSTTRTAAKRLEDDEQPEVTPQPTTTIKEDEEEQSRCSSSTRRGAPPRPELFRNNSAFQQFQEESHFHLKKTVTFDPDPPMVHSFPHASGLTPDEEEGLWYDTETIEFFREMNMVTAKALFFNTNEHSVGTQRERVRTFVEFYQFCVDEAAREDGRQSKHGSSVKKQRTKFRKRLAQVYHRDNVLGLESFVLTAKRGGAKTLRQFIFDHAFMRIQRELLLGNDGHDEESKDSDDEEGHTEADISTNPADEPDVAAGAGTAASTTTTTTTPYHQMDKKAKILAHVSHAVSRPSCLLAHEMALAHAQTLDREY